MNRQKKLREVLIKNEGKDAVKEIRYHRLKHGDNPERMEKRNKLIRKYLHVIPEDRFTIGEMCEFTGLSTQSVFDIKHKK